MPTYRLSMPGQPDELITADGWCVEGAHTVLRGPAYVMGRPRDIVVRRVPMTVTVTLIDADARAPEHRICHVG